MSSSSSSDSEDEGRFRDACDPSLSYSYEKNPDQKYAGMYDTGGVFESKGISGGSSSRPTESRESFVLYNQIQNILSTGSAFAKHKTWSGIEQLSSDLTTGRRKKNSPCNNDLASSMSPYLAKHLDKLLDMKVEIGQPEASTSELSKETSGRGEMLLLKDIRIHSVTDNKEASLVNRRNRVPDKHNEKEIFLRCQSVALSPQFILDKQDVYPWPHPKNLRYLESYRVKKKKVDGSLEVVPLSDNSATEERQKILMEEKMIKEKLETKGTNKVVSEIKNFINLKEKKAVANGTPDRNLQSGKKEKKRKQSKKRGGRKQKKKQKKLDDTFDNKGI
ncbi:uncharacterized protein [Macrobrachium rosenbergii]|uniref:uncharacterized protein isoform X1 n=1 Tax=Macrobrachium rosenbergii TaxID=79674 RepID=UPI0034D5EC85